MKQNKMSREDFWKNGGEVNLEMADYMRVTDSSKEEEFSFLDEFLTLICC